jgi:branched-chain amino acid aminotransferase/para-aminobenzoate synthetase component 1
MSPEKYIFLNDKLVAAAEAVISVEDRGFLYGDGFFETIRAEAGRPLFWPEHLERLIDSTRAFRIDLPPDIPWLDRLQTLLVRNDLAGRTAAVKILVTRGKSPALGLPPGRQPTIVIYVRPYDPPPEIEYQRGWPVVTFPEPRTCFVGQYKSLNYLYCLAARQYALDRGAREAIFLENLEVVSEGAATALIYAQGEDFFTPRSASSLKSITVAVLGRALTIRGFSLRAKKITLENLQHADGVWLANSLMGLLPVASLDGLPLLLSPQTDFLNQCLWAEAN